MEEGEVSTPEKASTVKTSFFVFFFFFFFIFLLF
jgi:hypothetical protein